MIALGTEKWFDMSDTGTAVSEGQKYWTGAERILLISDNSSTPFSNLEYSLFQRLACEYVCILFSCRFDVVSQTQRERESANLVSLEELLKSYLQLGKYSHWEGLRKEVLSVIVKLFPNLSFRLICPNICLDYFIGKV